MTEPRRSLPLRRLFVTAGIAAVLFAAVTLLALEGHEVVVLRTFDAQGSGYESRTWIADEDGYAWIEAANPERPFLQRLQRQREVELIRDGRAQRYQATPMPNPDGHQRIRRLLAAKYGIADGWIGLLEDTSGSIGIRLERRD